MSNFQGHSFWKRLLHSNLGILVCSIFLLLFLFNIIKFTIKNFETRKNRQVAKEQLDNLQREKQLLQNDIEKLKTEDGVEESIRDKFGLAKDGEGLVVIVDEENKKTEEKQKKLANFWDKFKEWFR